MDLNQDLDDEQTIISSEDDLSENFKNFAAEFVAFERNKLFATTDPQDLEKLSDEIKKKTYWSWTYQ